jgi:pimeloyl-ACP methyl ester carboxylesterase
VADPGRPAEPASRFWPFLAGILAGAAGAVLAAALTPRRRLDPRLIKASPHNPDLPGVVLIPGILGTQLLRPDGTQAWLNLGNAFGYHDLTLPLTLPLSGSRDELVPGPLLGTDTVLPRVFGFTEYADVIDLLEDAGFSAGRLRPGRPDYHVFSYDWRRDLVESARALHEHLEALAEARGDAQARFNLIGHSMGGLVARYYLRFGTAEPDENAPVTWAGARRIRHLVLVSAPNGGSIPALNAILNGERVGLSYTTLAAPVISRMPSIYQLLPPAGASALLHRGQPLEADLHELSTWQRFGWGPFRPRSLPRPPGGEAEPAGEREAGRAFLGAVLARARAFHRALARRPDTPCPTRVLVLGGDCLPTLARAVVAPRRGVSPRFEPLDPRESEAMHEAGDGRVTRASVLAAHLPGADDAESGSGLPEVTQAFFGSAEHHGIYREPTFQSMLLRLLLRPLPRPLPRGALASELPSEPVAPQLLGG